MKTRFDRMRAWLHGLGVSDAQVARDAARGNMRRLLWLVPIFLALDLVLLAAFSLGSTDASPQHLAWRSAISTVYVATAIWLVLVWPVAWRLAGRDQGVAVRTMQFIAPMSFLVFTIALTWIDQRVTSNISPYLLGCMSIGLLFLLRPAESVWLFLIAYALFFVGMGVSQSDPTLLLTNRANGFGASLLALVLSIGLWHRNAQYALLQRELTARNATLEKQQAELLWLATRDALTGLHNRGEFLRVAEQELMRTQRHGGDTSAIMIDLDYFKAINDRHGHPAGDKVLEHVARCLLRGVRATDVVARIGGEEFMVLLPQTDIDSAAGLAHKLNRQLRQSKAQIGSTLAIDITASFGVACMPGGHEGTVASLYAAADNALYEAKRRGRDRVERTEPDATMTPSDFQRMRRQ